MVSPTDDTGVKGKGKRAHATSRHQANSPEETKLSPHRDGSIASQLVRVQVEINVLKPEESREK